MQPTYVGTKKSTAIHTSQSIWYVELPDEHAELLFWRPRHALEIPEESSVPGSPTKAFRGPLTLHRLQRVGDSVHSVRDTVKPASTVAFSTIAVVFSQVVLLMKRAEKMLHSFFILLYRAAAGALNRQRCAVAPLRGGGGGVRGGCGGGDTFAALIRFHFFLCYKSNKACMFCYSDKRPLGIEGSPAPSPRKRLYYMYNIPGELANQTAK
jgi:hypothetical protein